MSGDNHDLTAIVLDTDVTSRMWRAALPAEIERSSAGRRLLVTFVTKGEALEGAYRMMTWNRRHFEPLEPFGLTLL